MSDDEKLTDLRQQLAEKFAEIVNWKIGLDRQRKVAQVLRGDVAAATQRADLREAEAELIQSRLAASEVERAELLEQLRQQTRSFCTHCGKLFPRGKSGIADFRAHIAECNVHPLHGMAVERDELRTALAEARAEVNRLRAASQVLPS